MEVREGMSDVVLTVGPGHSLREAAQRMLGGVRVAEVRREASDGERDNRKRAED